jgi:predicted nucleotidyltransferase
MSSTDDWITILPKTKKNSATNKIKKQIMMSFEDLTHKLNSILVPYSPEAIFVYGSRARETNRPDSDADIMVFWKSSLIPDIEILQDIKQTIIETLKLNVDFVVMKLTSKFIKVHDARTICYYDNVKVDARCIYSQKNREHISGLIDFSEKLQKI